MTYNLLFYNLNSDPRDYYFRKTILATQPDIIVVQEIEFQHVVNNFLNNVLNYYTPGLYKAGTFIDGPSLDRALYYKQSKFNFIINSPISTPGGRDINAFLVQHISTNKQLILLGLHLKAGSYPSNQQQRVAEVNALRGFTNTLNPGTDFIVLGDFNIYGSYEVAYQNLLQVQSQNEGHCIDPINISGTWNNYSYRQYHTQSTRKRSFGGGSTGGLDDRFDMILYSKAVSEPGGITYIPNSLTEFGNDSNHYNDSINKRPNTAVQDSIADALHYASDHLPVYSLFEFKQNVSVKQISNIIPENYNLYQNYPNPFNPSTKIRFDVPAGESSEVKLSVYNILGKEIDVLVNEKLAPGRYEVNWPANAGNVLDYSTGVYFFRMFTDNVLLTKKMLLIK
jgi:endonuclease/exonuclease/phosphatase family metal-dependent hydrolase